MIISLIEKKGFRISAAAKLSNFDKNCNIKEGFCYTMENYIQLLHQGKLIVTSRKYLTKRLKKNAFKMAHCIVILTKCLSPLILIAAYMPYTFSMNLL